MTGTSATEDLRVGALHRGFDGFEIRTVVRDGVRLGYRVRGEGEPVVLVHGFPQSGYAFRDIANSLARDFRVIVPDYRGAAGSDAPEGGYDKATMAEDLRAVVIDAGADRIHLVGHDIGTTLAFAYATAHTEDVATLALLDGIVPGTPTMALIVGSGRPWHFGFHSQVALATALLTDREAIYLDWMFDTNSIEPASITEDQRTFAVRALQAPGALAAASKTYAAWFTHDAPANEAFLTERGKLTLPLLVAGGEASLGPLMPMVAADIATDITSEIIGGAGHFVLDEQPAETERVLRIFLETHAGLASRREPAISIDGRVGGAAD